MTALVAVIHLGGNTLDVLKQSNHLFFPDHACNIGWVRVLLSWVKHDVGFNLM